MDYTPRPTGKPIDIRAMYQRIMARYPKIMARLRESELSEPRT